MVRYAFGALGMRRVGLTYPAGNEASRHTAEKLGFTFEGVQKGANVLPGGKNADRYCCARFDVADWARGALASESGSVGFRLVLIRESACVACVYRSALFHVDV